MRDYFEVWEKLALMGARIKEMVAANDSCLWQNTQQGCRLFDDMRLDLRVHRKINNRIRVADAICASGGR